MIYFDLNQFSGGPHWLSPMGKVDKDGIRAKHRAAHHAKLRAEHKPVKAETTADLQRVLDWHKQIEANRYASEPDGSGSEHDEAAWRKHRERHLPKPLPQKTSREIAAAWNSSIAILDRSELPVRDVIERELVDIAGIPGIRLGEVRKAADRALIKIKAIRLKAFRDAFRHLRSKL